MKDPKVGDSVYYKARGSADGRFPKVDRAAIVTDVRQVTRKDDGTYKYPHDEKNVVDGAYMDYQCRVVVLNPEGIFFSDWLDRGQDGGQWDFIFA